MVFSELKQRQAHVWGCAPYETVSGQHVDVIDRLLDRLDVGPGLRLLDVATGSGELARPAATRGASVTAVDFAPAMVEAARRRAAEEQLVIDVQLGDAEALPCPDASFDVVASSFGVMFCPDHRAVARELGRVCRTAGTLGLACWILDAGFADVFKAMAPYQPPAPEGVGRPFDWGERGYVEELLGADFDLEFADVDAPQVGASGEEMWTLLETGYGPVKALVGSLEDVRRAQLQADVVAAFERHRRNGSIHLSRRALLTIGTRR